MRIGNFGNKITERDGQVFDSLSEANDWTMLQLRQRAGQISELERPKPMILQPAFTDNEGTRHKAITWKPDFTYVENGQRVVYDTKGHRTVRFNLVEKMFRYTYPEIRLIIHQVGKGRKR